MYKPGGTIVQTLQMLENREYLLPAIQREFVWKPEQITKLFDTLMQGIPFGTFLFWKLQPQTAAQVKFYDFTLNYDERDTEHCAEMPKITKGVTAVLDGQQRLTAINIGLRGSMTLKRHRKHRNNPDAYRRQRLYFNLLRENEADEEGNKYEFRFLDDGQAGLQGDAFWFPVPDILLMGDGHPLLTWLMGKGLAGDRLNIAYKNVDRLYRTIHTEHSTHFYETEVQDLEHVLNIFIRLNSGGTPLSSSDLLLSMAVAQWEHEDARSEIRTLVRDINGIGSGFNLSQDFVLKCGLMLADAQVGFSIQNFTADNMKPLERQWSEIRKAILKAIELAASFGLHEGNLRSSNSLMPIAYYIYRIGTPEGFVRSRTFRRDREVIRTWLLRSLLKTSGIWGGAVDTTLTFMREIIRHNHAAGFPIEELAAAMKKRGKGIDFDEDDVEDLLSMTYSDKRTFALLSLLFPFVDLSNHFHVDHFFARTRFSTAQRIINAGAAEDRVVDYQRMCEELPNLHLLQGTQNMEKREAMPRQWIAQTITDAAARVAYMRDHLIPEIPQDLAGFDAFFTARRLLMAGRIRDVLGDLAPGVVREVKREVRAPSARGGSGVLDLFEAPSVAHVVVPAGRLI